MWQQKYKVSTNMFMQASYTKASQVYNYNLTVSFEYVTALLEKYLFFIDV